MTYTAMIVTIGVFALIAGLGSLLVGCARTHPAWIATPNLWQVSPGIWRSGQPATTEEWITLRKLGVRHVVKLNFDSEGSDDAAEALGLDVHKLAFQPEGDKDIFSNLENTLVKPEAGTLAAALGVLAAGGGVLVHCTHGQDRTGLVIGLWRVLQDKQTKNAAYEEMLRRGFHPELHGLHEFWEHFDGSRL